MAAAWAWMETDDTVFLPKLLPHFPLNTTPPPPVGDILPARTSNVLNIMFAADFTDSKFSLIHTVFNTDAFFKDDESTGKGIFC